MTPKGFELSSLLLVALLAAAGCATTIAQPAAQVAEPVEDSPASPSLDASPTLLDRGYADELELNTRLALAMALNEEAEWRAAMEHLKVLVENWPGGWSVQFEYGRALYRLGGEPARVKAALERSIEEREYNPRAWLMLGQLAEDTESYAEAERHYRKAIEQRDINGSASFALARVLRSQERPEEAITVLTDVIGREGSQVRLLIQLAGAYEEANQLEHAEATWRRVAVLHTDPLQGNTMLYRFLRRTGRTAAAAEVAATITRLKSARTSARELRPLRPSMDYRGTDTTSDGTAAPTGGDGAVSTPLEAPPSPVSEPLDGE